MRYVTTTVFCVVFWRFVVVCFANPLLTVNWVLEHKGAQFDFAKQRIEWVDDDVHDNNHGDNNLSIVAQALIRKGEILATIPWSILITPTTTKMTKAKTLTTDHPHAKFPCDLVRKMATEVRKGDQSKWAPYVQHLRYWYSNKKLPSQFSDQAQIVWKQIWGGSESKMILPVPHVAEDWNILCGGKWQKDDDDKAILQEAAMWVQQHAFQDLMIPLKDLYTHRNGKYHNVEVVVDPEVGIQIVAKRDIEPGEQLHTSYTNCETCGRDQDDDYEYGTPGIFRDHGIIERMPQLWTVVEPPTRIPYIDDEGEASVMLAEGLRASFRLQEGPLGDVQVDFLWSDMLDPVFHPVVDALMRERIQELHRLKNIKYSLSADAYGIAVDEWNTIWEFHKAYSTALKLAAYTLHNIMINQSSPRGDSDDDGEQQEFCRVLDQWDDHYTDFRYVPDQVAYKASDCQSSEFVDFINYKVLEVERTNYQEMRWQYRSDDDDTCLHLDDMLQICSSYRPHYHEFFVHFPARYVPSIQRVLFLGAGDAMLLHEILKYPSLEKVVGLELDQTITRKSFQYFKTQPHYDDPRVEWWYGDATKTLPLLPRDYWGSFDLVLVDLSETVVSLNVARQHNVLDVISMLLKPEGVLLENELYLERMIQHFDHTAQIFYGSPKVCVQIHTLSSHSIDFLRSPIYNHQVDAFLVDHVNTTVDRFKFIHDYANRDTLAQDKCDNNHWNTTTTTTTVHGRKAGVLMVLEAENCSRVLLEDSESLEVLIYRILTEQGLSPLSSLQRKTSFSTIQIILKEGYVIARLWDKFHYIGFDFYWWGAFSKMEAVRDATADALEATTRSSYRVVVGGMYGSTTWEQDQNEIGVQFSPKRRKCTPPNLAWQPELHPSEAIQVAMDESLHLLKEPSDLVVLVACGDEDKQDECLTLQILKDNVNVVRVVPFFACEGLPYFNNGSFAFEPMYNCERDILDRLSKFHDTDNLRYGALVVDWSAPLSMLQIFSSVWTIAEHRNQWLAPDYIVAVPWVPSEPQRQQFLESFRRISHWTVTTLADFRLESVDADADNNSGTEDNFFLGWGVLTVNDEYAIYSLSRMENRLKDRLPKAAIEARRMEGGQLHRPEDLLLEQRSFGPNDYDDGSHAKQMAEQCALGRQTIFQLETSRNDTCVSIPELLVMALEKTLETLEYHDGPAMLPPETQTWIELGEGVVVTSIFATGNVVLVWDGVDHVAVNLFDEDQSRDRADMFLDVFLLQTEWKLLLRDDQPRGYGRVVNFSQ